MSEDTKDPTHIEAPNEEKGSLDNHQIPKNMEEAVQQQNTHPSQNVEPLPLPQEMLHQTNLSGQYAPETTQELQQNIEAQLPTEEENPQTEPHPEGQQQNHNQEEIKTENDEYEFESKMGENYTGEVEQSDIPQNETRTQTIVEQQYQLEPMEQFGDSILGHNDGQEGLSSNRLDGAQSDKIQNTSQLKDQPVVQNEGQKIGEIEPDKGESDRVSKSAIVQSDKDVIQVQKKVVKSDMTKTNKVEEILQGDSYQQQGQEETIQAQGSGQKAAVQKEQEQINPVVEIEKVQEILPEKTSSIHDNQGQSLENKQTKAPQTSTNAPQPAKQDENKSIPEEMTKVAPEQVKESVSNISKNIPKHQEKKQSIANKQQGKKQSSNFQKKKKQFKAYSVSSSSSSDSQQEERIRIKQIKEQKQLKEAEDKQRREDEQRQREEAERIDKLNQLKAHVRAQRKYSDEEDAPVDTDKKEEVVETQKQQGKSKRKRKRKHHIKQQQKPNNQGKPIKQTKLKTVEHQKIYTQQTPKQSDYPSPPSDPKGDKPQLSSEQLPTNATLAIQKTQIQHQIQIEPARHQENERDPDIPPLTSQTVVVEAHKQRMDSTYNLFLKYVFNYTKALNNYKTVVHNVSTQILNRKNHRRQLQSVLMDYFDNYAKLNIELNERCHSFQQPQPPMSNNPFGNLKLQFRDSYRELLNMRKITANEYAKNGSFVINSIISKINSAFAVYYNSIQTEESRQRQRRSQQFQREKVLFKVISQVEKVFKKGIKGKFKVDILTQLARFVNEQITHREYLKIYGKGLMPLRDTFKSAQQTLFHTLQPILNDFKNNSNMIYSLHHSRYFQAFEDLTFTIRQVTKFDDLSPLTDIDYIKYVLELQQKKDFKRFKTRHFENFLDLIYLDRLVGNIRDLYKGATCKIFPMAVEHEELIHTISGNLVHFNVDSDQCINTFNIKNINARILAEGMVEFDELLKGLIFDDSRTVRIKLKDSDRAQQLICYLNEKEQDIVIEPELEARRSMQ